MTVDNDLLAHADGAILQSRRLVGELHLSIARLHETWAKLYASHGLLLVGVGPGAGRHDEEP